jgi:precorrin-2 dehydrogenase / sirohydrochlorin ferrochelatase
MIPIMLDPALVHVGLCGEGVLTLRRFEWLRACGAMPIVFAPSPSPELRAAAGKVVVERLPLEADILHLGALWIADFDLEISAPIADVSRRLGVLVNVEDVLDYCDFHTPAVVHRRRLTFAIGTGGASPALASTIRQRLEQQFPDAWADLIEEVAASRLELKTKGATFAELIADAKTKLVASGL